MGIFDKFKQSMNIGGVSVKLAVPATVERHAGALSGQMTFTTKSPQAVERITILVEETMVKDKQPGQSMGEHKTLEIGKVEMSEPFSLKPGEEKIIPFTVQFTPGYSLNEELKSDGGVASALGVLGNMMDNTRRTWTVSADADVANAAINAMDSVSINLT